MFFFLGLKASPVAWTSFMEAWKNSAVNLFQFLVIQTTDPDSVNPDPKH
jgi:hypothetical protein